MAQLYQIVRGVLPDQLAWMQHPPVCNGIVVVVDWRCKSEEESGEEGGGGVLDDERVVDAPNEFTHREKLLKATTLRNSALIHLPLLQYLDMIMTWHCTKPSS